MEENLTIWECIGQSGEYQADLSDGSLASLVTNETDGTWSVSSITEGRDGHLWRGIGVTSKSIRLMANWTNEVVNFVQVTDHDLASHVLPMFGWKRIEV